MFGNIRQFRIRASGVFWKNVPNITGANGVTIAPVNYNSYVRGGTDPYVISVVSGLPAGLTLTSGILSGTPSATTTTPFVIRVTDAALKTDDHSVSVSIT